MPTTPSVYAPPPSGRPSEQNLAPRDSEGLSQELVAYHALFSPLFVREEQRRWALAYLQGQLLALDRKSIEPMARDFEHTGALAAQGWDSTSGTSGRNVSRMLDYLWLKGEIMVAGRAGGQKRWDLAARCLPAWTPTAPLPGREVVRQATQRSLRALGVARPRHIQDHFIRGRYPDLAGVLAELEAEGRIVRVAVAGEDGQLPGPWYVHADDLPLLDRLATGDWQPRTTLLSPFDNLICDRARAALLFGFDFRIEIYVPKAQRRYGYYVLPILHGDRLIGRLDPALDRRRGRLTLNAVHAEPAAPADDETAAAVAAAVADLARFLGAREIVLPAQVPPGWERALRELE